MAFRYGNHGSEPYQGTNPYAQGQPLKVRRRVFPRGSIWAKIVIVSSIIVAVCFGSYCIGLGISSLSMKGKAEAAVSSAKGYLTAAKEGDQSALKKSAQGLSDAAHQIDEELKGPVWEFSSRLPFVGTDIASVRTLALLFEDFADNALTPMAESGNILALKDFANDDSINFEALPGLLAALDELLPALNRTARTLESMPEGHIPFLAQAMNEVKTKIISTDKFVTRIRPVFPYLPEIFGADGETRNYLVLAQNNAEIHAIGGFVGAVGVLSITNGKIEMGDFMGIGDALNAYEEPSGATEEEKNDFGERADVFHGDHNVIPDFTRVGQLYFNIWNHYHDFELDGVLGFDPVFLQYLLGACGSVETSKGVTVDETNCAAVMLNQSLFWWQPSECDAFYSEIANKALSKILGDLDNIDLSKFIDAVAKAGDENRCMIWIHDEEAENALKTAGFGGEVKHDVAKPELGVFISDASTSKMSYYLSNDVSVGEGVVNSDGSVSYDVNITITNNFDSTARNVFPPYLTVQRSILISGRNDCDLFEEVRILAPEGGSITNLTSERINTREGTPEDSGWSEKSYQGLVLESADFRLDQQETVAIRFTVTTSNAAVEPLTVRKTPLIPEEYAYWNEDLSERYDNWHIEKTI